MPTLLSRLKAIPYLPLLTLLTVLRLVTAARAGLVPDESYYWLWAQHPDIGYYDHPAMVAWWIGASTTVLGNWTLAVRLPFILSFLAAAWLMFDAAKRLFGEAVAKRTLLWLNACLMLSVGSVIATPDPPSVLMWVLGLWALARLQASGKGAWWLVFGLAAGLGVEAKYTNFFLGLGVVAWVAIDKDARRWLLTPWPYLGALVALAAMAPNLLWNASHHWATVEKQFGRIDSGGFTIKYLIEFLISQPLILNPLIFVFVVTGVAVWWRNRGDSRYALLVALPLPLFAYLLVHVFHDRIQGNWPAPAFPGLVLLAAAAAEGISGKTLLRIRTWAAPLGIVLSALALAYLGLGDTGLRLAGAAGLSQGWDRVAARIDDMARANGAAWIATTDYDTEGELSYHMIAPYHRTVIAVSERERYNWPTPEAEVVGQPALIVIPAGHTLKLDACFADLTDLGTVSRLKTSSPKSDFRVYRGKLKSVGCVIAD